MNQRVIEYTNAISDGVALIDYHSRHSPVARQQWWFGAIAGVVVILLLMVSDGASTAELVAGASLVLVVYWLGSPRYFRWNARRLYGEAANKGVLGRHRLTLSERGLLSENDSGQSVTHYDALEKVVETPGHVFVFTNALSAYVVPKTGIVDGDLDAFLQDLRGRL